MQLTQNPLTGDHFIKSYSPGDIQINDTHYKNSLIIASDKLIENWPPQTITEFQPHYLDAIIQLHPEIVLLGTGEKQHFVDNRLLLPLINNHIGFEIMHTAAACRTFNLLAGEGRRVVAGLMMR